MSGEIVYRAAELGESRCKVFLSLFLVTGRRIQLADLTCKGGAVSSGNTGRREGSHRLVIVLPNRINFLLLVNCIEQCTTEIYIGEILVIVVEVNVECGTIRIRLNRSTCCCSLLDEFAGAETDHIQVACEEGGESCVGIGDDLPIDLFNFYVCCAVPCIVFLHNDLIVVAPLGKSERAVRAEVLRFGGVEVCAYSLIESLVDRSKGAEGEQEQCVRSRLLQGNLEGIIIDNLYTNFVPSNFTVEVLFSVLDEVEEVSVIRSNIRVQSLTPSKLEVLRRNRVAVCPNAVLTEVEGVGEGILIVVPALSCARGCVVVIVEGDEVLIHVLEQGELNGVCGGQGVQACRLHTCVQADRLCSVYGLRGEGCRSVTGCSRGGISGGGGLGGFCAAFRSCDALGRCLGAVAAAPSECGNNQRRGQNQS